MSFVQMTLYGGMFILFIVVVRALALHRLPKGTFLVLWEMSALRLLLPFTIPLPFSAFAPVGGLPVVGAYLTAGGVSTLGTQTAEMPTCTPALTDTVSGAVLPMVWLVGAVLMAAYFIMLYVRARRWFRCSSPDNTPAIRRWLAGRTLRRSLEVRQSAMVSSPLTYGVLRPIILFPEDMDREDESALIYILTHEYIHIRRFDSAAKLVFVAVLCVHWFNPLAWVMYVLANRDLELSCDEQVMDTLGGREKASYALTLINMEETRSRFFSLYNHFSKLAIEERIEAIMKYKKTSVLAVSIAVALIVSATTAFAASATEDTEFGNFITDEDGSQWPASSNQVVGSTRFSVDKDGNLTPNPDEELGELLEALNIPEHQFDLDGDTEYKWELKGQEDLDEENTFLPPTRTEEEWQQIIADIESGKIPPLEIPDDPNVTIGFEDYTGGSCTAKD